MTIHNAGVLLVCGGKKMKELVPNAVEAGGEKPVAIYAHCNLHGLWMTKL